MTSINPSYINVSSLQKLHGEIKPSKLSDEAITRINKAKEAFYKKPTNLDELQNHLSQKPYAEVKVGGKVVATLFNSGVASTPNAMAGKILELPSMSESEQTTGPELAQKRAEEIAKALGGTIVKSSSAVTQAQYLATPPFQIKYDINYEKMEAALGRVSTPQTTSDTQSLAQSDEKSSVAISAKEEFLKFQSMSWEEKIRAMILRSMDMTEEQVAALSPEEREKLESKIKEKIEEEIEKKTGMKSTPASLMSQG